jgi:hypothetical protein
MGVGRHHGVRQSSSVGNAQGAAEKTDTSVYPQE